MSMRTKKPPSKHNTAVSRKELSRAEVRLVEGRTVELTNLQLHLAGSGRLLTLTLFFECQLQAGKLTYQGAIQALVECFFFPSVCHLFAWPIEEYVTVCFMCCSMAFRHTTILSFCCRSWLAMANTSSNHVPASPSLLLFPPTKGLPTSTHIMERCGKFFSLSVVLSQNFFSKFQIQTVLYYFPSHAGWRREAVYS